MIATTHSCIYFFYLFIYPNEATLPKMHSSIKQRLTEPKHGILFVFEAVFRSLDMTATTSPPTMWEQRTRDAFHTQLFIGNLDNIRFINEVQYSFPSS